MLFVWFGRVVDLWFFVKRGYWLLILSPPWFRLLLLCWCFVLVVGDSSFMESVSFVALFEAFGSMADFRLSDGA